MSWIFLKKVLSKGTAMDSGTHQSSNAEILWQLYAEGHAASSDMKSRIHTCPYHGLF